VKHCARMQHASCMWMVYRRGDDMCSGFQARRRSVARRFDSKLASNHLHT